MCVCVWGHLELLTKDFWLNQHLDTHARVAAVSKPVSDHI